MGFIYVQLLSCPELDLGRQRSVLPQQLFPMPVKRVFRRCGGTLRAVKSWGWWEGANTSVPGQGGRRGGTWGSVQLLIRVLLFPKLGTEWNVESEVITGRWSGRTWNFSADTDLYCAFKARSTSEHCSSCAYPQISLCLYSLSCKCIFSNAVDTKTCIMKRGHIGLASVFILGSLHLWSLTSTWAQVDVNPNPGLSELFWNSNPRCLQSM